MSSVLCLRTFNLSTAWQPLTALIPCNVVILTSDVTWQYCSETEYEGALTTVSPYTREPIPFVSPSSRLARFSKGTTIIYVRAKDTPGQCWVQYIY